MDTKDKVEQERKAVEEKVQRYRDRLIKQSSAPPPARPSKEERIEARLVRSEVLLATSNRLRITRLIAHMSHANAAGHMRKVYADALEITHMARVEVLGMEQAHPVLTTQTQGGLTMLPPPEEESG